MQTDVPIKVTVYFSTFNQEPYVAQALESILMQKTNFRFEIIAADDCSTDRTQEIILDYQRRFPGMIETYFTNPNVGGCRKLTNCIEKGLFRGEYLTFLEGDDYWLGEDRLQTLVDFLEANPKYSRVSHKRRVIDENDCDKGFDIPEVIVGRAFTIEDFLAGYAYSDFGSVFRNYFRQAGNKYNELLRTSRNVCDFPDMFITQDFGPVYVMDACYGVYRSRSVAGATNYNSITSHSARRKENIRLCRAVEAFYGGKYDLSPMIRTNQKQLLTEAVKARDSEAFKEARGFVSSNELKEILPEILYLELRGGRKENVLFMREQLSKVEKKGLSLRAARYSILRLKQKAMHNRPDEKRRGYVRNRFIKNETLTSIAFIIPYFGKLPDYLPVWLASCAQNPSIDFYIFTDDSREFKHSDNVHFVSMTFDQVKELLQGQFDFPIHLSTPYKLCDYRPVFGLAFSKYLERYEFWGHCDLDLIWGNIRHFFTEDRLKEYDRLLWLGHCSIYRNCDRMNNAFRLLDPCGCMEWKKVYTDDKLQSYDEYAEHNGGGISLIMEKNGVHLFKQWVHADLCVGLNRFQCSYTENSF